MGYTLCKGSSDVWLKIRICRNLNSGFFLDGTWRKRQLKFPVRPLRISNGIALTEINTEPFELLCLQPSELITYESAVTDHFADAKSNLMGHFYSLPICNSHNSDLIVWLIVHLDAWSEYYSWFYELSKCICNNAKNIWSDKAVFILPPPPKKKEINEGTVVNKEGAIHSLAYLAIHPQWLTAPSTGHFCNEGRISRSILSRARGAGSPLTL